MHGTTSSMFRLTQLPYHPQDKNIKWLVQSHVLFREDMYKTEIYSLIKYHKPRMKMFKVDVLFAEKDHIVLRLPPPPSS